MFVSAIEKISAFTRPIHTITRTYNGTISNGAGTLFFVNDNGVAVSCKHVAELLIQAELVNKRFADFNEEKAKIPAGKGHRAQLQGLEAKYGLKKDMIVQIKHSLLNVGNFTDITCHLHPDLDLAVIVLNGLTDKAYASHATFINNPDKIKQGKYLCRYGYPFPEFDNYKLNEVTNDIEWTNVGKMNSPSFPLDGIITRYIGTAEKITAIEMSTPGLRGQSGGPLFDEEGLVYGMQYATNHLHLGFDIKDMEIFINGKKEKVSDSAFLHVGHCIHVDIIKEFLREKGIAFFE